MTYDSAGNVLTKTDPLGSVTRFRYDAKRRIVGEVGPDPDGSGPRKNRATRTTYDTAGRLTLVETGVVASQSDADWAGFTALESVSTTYDALDRKIQENRNSGGYTHGVTQWSYDAAGRLQCTAVRLNFNAGVPASACTQGTLGIYGPDRITLLTYDDAGKLLKITSGYLTSAQRDEEARSYGADGEVLTRTDARGNLTTYVYDGLDRVSQIQYPSLANGTASSKTDYEGYTYDGNDNVLSDRRRDGQTISYTYDALNNKLTGANSASFSYDNLSRRLTANVPYLNYSFTYDALGRETKETTPMGDVTKTYDLAGRRINLKWPDGFNIGYAYYPTDDVWFIADGSTFLTTYSYDDLGRRTSIGRGPSSVATYLYYDGNQRLSQLSHRFPDGSKNQDQYFYWNPAEQLTSMNTSNSLYDWTSAYYAQRYYTPNSQNGYVSAGSVSYTYDGRANLSGDGTNTYGYTIDNKLNAAGSWGLYYDGLDRLFHVTQAPASTTTRFLYDGDQIIGEYNSSNQLLRRFVPGPKADETIVWYEGGVGSTDRRWLVADRMGSTVAVVNATGTVTGINTYDEAGIPGAGNIGRFQWNGQPWIAEVGLYHNRARAYSPTLGRFMQTDPVLYQDGMSWYTYAHDDPVNSSDPAGTCTGSILADSAGNCTSASGIGSHIEHLKPDDAANLKRPLIVAGGIARNFVKDAGETLLRLVTGKATAKDYLMAGMLLPVAGEAGAAEGAFTKLRDTTARGALIPNVEISVSAKEIGQTLEAGGFSSRSLTKGAVEYSRSGSGLRFVLREAKSTKAGGALDVYLQGVKVTTYRPGP